MKKTKKRTPIKQFFHKLQNRAHDVVVSNGIGTENELEVYSCIYKSQYLSSFVEDLYEKFPDVKNYISERVQLMAN